MKLVLFGASGAIGKRVLTEALARGHEVKAIMRHPEQLGIKHPCLKVEKGNILDLSQVTRAVIDADAVLLAVGSRDTEPPQMIVDAAHALIAGLVQAKIERLIVVPGA